MKPRNMILCALVAVAISMAAPAFAENVELTVAVSDKNGPVEGAQVTLGGTAGFFGATTDSNGEAVFNVPEGQYTLTCTADGYPLYSEVINVGPDRRRRVAIVVG